MRSPYLSLRHCWSACSRTDSRRMSRYARSARSGLERGSDYALEALSDGADDARAEYKNLAGLSQTQGKDREIDSSLLGSS